MTPAKCVMLIRCLSNNAVEFLNSRYISTACCSVAHATARSMYSQACFYSCYRLYPTIHRVGGGMSNRSFARSWLERDLQRGDLSLRDFALFREPRPSGPPMTSYKGR